MIHRHKKHWKFIYINTQWDKNLNLAIWKRTKQKIFLWVWNLLSSVGGHYFHNWHIGCFEGETVNELTSFFEYPWRAQMQQTTLSALRLFKHIYVHLSGCCKSVYHRTVYIPHKDLLLKWSEFCGMLIFVCQLFEIWLFKSNKKWNQWMRIDEERAEIFEQIEELRCSIKLKQE